MLLGFLLSPVIMAVIVGLVVVYAKVSNLPKPGIDRLVARSVKYAAVGAGASLVLLIVLMIWYEQTTGYSAGNAPLGWLFFYGPVSAALGQMVALILWWREKRL